jgi:tetratricopeptide (TPR) repeat protein
MEQNRLVSLAQEVEEYRRYKKYRDCIKQMDMYAKRERDPEVRLGIFMAKATCALQLGDHVAARKALDAVDRNSLSETKGIYFDLILVTLLQEEGNLSEARKILAHNLARQDLLRSEHRDALCEFLARMGFVLADLGDFEVSMKFLNQSLGLMKNDDDLHDTVLIYLGYCLQSKGCLDDAREYFVRVLNEGTGDVVADAYYRLGGVYLQQHNYDLAIAMFKEAENRLPNGRISLENILLAESDAYRANGQIDLAEDALRRSQSRQTIQ